MNKKLLLTSLTTGALFLSLAGTAHANQVPDFGSCLNPQWSKTQENISGNHGVIGIGSYTGTDTIYTSNGNVMQCLCTGTGKGYQTDWLKADKMSKDQISTMKTQGWIYVPYGDDWGLDKAPYIAKNTEYTCANCTPTPTPGVTTTPTPTVTETPGPTATPTPVSVVKGATHENTLANTGSAILIAIAVLAGLASLTAGTFLKKLAK